MSNEGIFDKVKDFLKGNPDKVDQGLDKAGELLNERTGGKYADQIAKGDDMVRQQLGVPDDQPGTPEPGATQPGATQPSATQPTSGPTPGGPLPGGDPDVSPTTTPEVPSAPNTPEPGFTPGGPGSTPPVTSPDPVPTTAPETVPEAAPDTAEGERP